MRWFSLPAAGLALVAGGAIGAHLADSALDMATLGVGEGVEQSYASSTPQGDRGSATPLNAALPAQIYHAPIYGCTNCARAKASRAAIDRYVSDYAAPAFAVADDEQRSEPLVLVDPPPSPVGRDRDMAAIDRYARYPLTETERDLRAIADDVARLAEQARPRLAAPVEPVEAAPLPAL